MPSQIFRRGLETIVFATALFFAGMYPIDASAQANSRRQCGLIDRCPSDSSETAKQERPKEEGLYFKKNGITVSVDVGGNPPLPNHGYYTREAFRKAFRVAMYNVGWNESETDGSYALPPPPFACTLSVFYRQCECALKGEDTIRMSYSLGGDREIMSELALTIDRAVDTAYVLHRRLSRK